MPYFTRRMIVLLSKENAKTVKKVLACTLLVLPLTQSFYLKGIY
jgi:hypothetical protein